MTTIEQMLDDFVAAIGTPNDAHAVREKIIEAFSQRSKDAALWQALSLDEQFALARRIASNVGYVLISEPSIQEAEDRAEASARSIGGSEAVEVGDLPILARFEQILAQWAIDDRTPPILRDDLRRFLSWFSPIRSRLVASPPGGSEAVGVLARLRGEGWSVAVHNDFYRLNGEAHTFWLLIHPSGRWAKGEGRTDDEALAAVSRSALTQPEGIAARDAVIEATHRHKKRGTTYTLIGYGRMQAERWEIVHELPSEPIQPADMAEVAIYRSVDDDSLWVRPREEFEDGRFETLRSPASRKDGNHA